MYKMLTNEYPFDIIDIQNDNYQIIEQMSYLDNYRFI